MTSDKLLVIYGLSLSDPPIYPEQVTHGREVEYRCFDSAQEIAQLDVTGRDIILHADSVRALFLEDGANSSDADFGALPYSIRRLLCRSSSAWLHGPDSGSIFWRPGGGWLMDLVDSMDGAEGPQQ